MGEGQERGVDLGKGGPDREVGGGQVRMVAADRVVVTVAPGQADDRDVRVARQQADELAARVAGRPDDPDPDPARAAVGHGAPDGTRQDAGRSDRLDIGG